MKRLIIAGILLALVVATYLTSLAYITNSCNGANELLSRSVSQYEKEKTAETAAGELEKYWDKKEKLLSAFVNHDRIDEVEEAISVLNVYANSEDDPLFYEYADTIKVLLHQIMEDTKITAHSIF